MNIFVLSFNPTEAAKYHCDKHVIKMILETTQLLYMCWASVGHEGWRNDLEKMLEENETLDKMKKNGQKVNLKTYKCGKGHMNHPCSKWVRESKANYIWLCKLGLELCKEKEYRWTKNKPHSCKGHLEILMDNIPEIPEIEITNFALAMPEEYKTSCAVDSYKKYYNIDKQHILKWSKRDPPNWIYSYKVRNQDAL